MRKLLPYLAAFLVCCGCENDLQQVQQLNEKTAGVEVAKDIQAYYYGTAGQIKAKLTAPLLYRHLNNPSYIEINDGLRMVFYNDSLETESVLTARKAHYTENGNDMWVKDSVVVINREGQRLDCQDLHWDQQQQQFYTHHPATVTTPTSVTYGQNGLIAPQDFSWYRLYSTSGQFEVDSSFAP